MKFFNQFIVIASATTFLLGAYPLIGQSSLEPTEIASSRTVETETPTLSETNDSYTPPDRGRPDRSQGAGTRT